MDNNGWPTLTPFVRYQYTYEFETTLVDGTVIPWTQTPSA